MLFGKHTCTNLIGWFLVHVKACIDKIADWLLSCNWFYMFPFYIVILGPPAKGRLFSFTHSSDCGSPAGFMTSPASAALSKKRGIWWNISQQLNRQGLTLFLICPFHLQVPKHLTRLAFEKIASFNTFPLSDCVNQLFCYLTIQTNWTQQTME